MCLTALKELFSFKYLDGPGLLDLDSMSTLLVVDSSRSLPTWCNEKHTQSVLSTTNSVNIVPRSNSHGPFKYLKVYSPFSQNILDLLDLPDHPDVDQTSKVPRIPERYYSWGCMTKLVRN